MVTTQAFDYIYLCAHITNTYSLRAVMLTSPLMCTRMHSYYTHTVVHLRETVSIIHYHVHGCALGACSAGQVPSVYYGGSNTRRVHF